MTMTTTPEAPISARPKPARLARRQERYSAAKAIELDLVELTDLDEPVLRYEPADDGCFL